MSPFLEIVRGEAPLLLSVPHTGVKSPTRSPRRSVSPWLARKDTDWHVERLYEFAQGLGATVLRTSISRTAIDVNRDPFRRLPVSGPGHHGALPDHNL
jgi:formiminoglutamase